jgi:hypothetical protein
LKLIKNLKKLKSGVGYLIYSRNVDEDDEHDYKRLVLFYLLQGETTLKYDDNTESRANANCIFDLMASDDWSIDHSHCLDDYANKPPSGPILVFEIADDEFANHVIAESI